MQEFIQLRQAIDTLIEDAKACLQKKSNSDALERIEHALLLLPKLKEIATSEQLEIVAKRASILDALMNPAIYKVVDTNQKKRTATRGMPCCIYTIKNKKDLDKAYKNGKSGSYTENKAWRTGLDHFIDAKNMGAYLPIVFADADSIWELLYWAKLTEVKILINTNKEIKSHDVTQYSFQDMKRYPKKDPPYNYTDLILDKTGERIQEGFIRPYAICRIPNYLK